MTVTTTNMSLLQAQGTDNARDYLKTYLATSLGLIDVHDHSNGKGLPVKRVANGTFAARPAAGNGGSVYVATDANRVAWDNGSSWIEGVINGTTQAVSLGGGLTLTAGSLTVSAGGLQVTAGTVGIGINPASGVGLWAQPTLSGGTQHAGIFSLPTGGVSATSSLEGVYTQVTTAAAAYTVGAAVGFHALNPVKGAGSTITTNYGVLVDAQTAGGTNNYGIFVNAPSGGSGVNQAIRATGDVQFDRSALLGGATNLIGFYGSAGITKQTITGSRSGGVALTNLLSVLNSIGLLNDSSTA